MDGLGSKLKVLYDFEYETRDKRKITIRKGEQLYLISKTDNDWWQVISNSNERAFFVPARSVEVYDDSDVNHVDNPIYGKPCDFIVPHEPVHIKRDFDDKNIQCKKHSEVHEGEERGKSPFIPVASRDVCKLKGDDCQATSCERTKQDSDLLNEELTHVEISKLSYGKYVNETSQHTVHPLPCSDEFKMVSFSHSSTCRFSPLSEKSELLKVNMMDERNSRISKETSTVNIGKIKSKLAKSRSFKTKNELQKLSRLDQSSVVPLPVESKIVDHCTVSRTFASAYNAKSDVTCNAHGHTLEIEHEKRNQNPVLIPLTFRNELYELSNNEEANKTMDSGNISSESLFPHEDDISDSGTSHKSGFVSSAPSKESIPDHSDLVADDAGKDELESSREDIWTAECYEDVPIPPGWRLDMDEESGEQCYINETTKAKWFSSTDGKGRVYFFEENSDVSSWTLPNIVVENEETAPENESSLDSSDLPLRIQDGEKKSRVGKARSLFLSDQKHKETTSKSSSIPRNWLQKYGVDKEVLMYGNMNRTKITENGKKMSKKWAPAHVLLTDDALRFFKDIKNSQHSGGLQPELSMQLFGARVESGEKLSSRKHIFLISSGSLQLLCECETAESAAQWRSAITSAIARLSRPVVNQAIKLSQDKPKTTSIVRSKSLQVKNREGTFDDAVSTEEQQMKIRDRLKKFFHRRPTREILASKGIYKDEPVFDSRLEKVCPSHPPYIPEFVKLCIAAIESKEENMRTDGLYRASGNLSHVQKIRLQVDQNNLSVLEAEEDVHVLTGALKLFFRELKEPLIPYEFFNEAIDAGGMNGSKKEKTKMFRDIVKKLPPHNHDTLKFLLEHLRRVTNFEEYNRMHVPNLAIVFGPTLMWREKEYHQNMAIEYMQQNLVIEFFLQQFDDIFR